MTDKGHWGTNFAVNIVLKDLRVFGHTPRLWWGGRVPVAGQIEGMRPVRGGQSVSQRTHALYTASPSVEEDERMCVFGSANLNVEVLVRHNRSYAGKPMYR